MRDATASTSSHLLPACWCRSRSVLIGRLSGRSQNKHLFQQHTDMAVSRPADSHWWVWAERDTHTQALHESQLSAFKFTTKVVILFRQVEVLNYSSGWMCASTTERPHAAPLLTKAGRSAASHYCNFSLPTNQWKSSSSRALFSKTWRHKTVGCCSGFLFLRLHISIFFASISST